jgi:putative ABC transport system permease protein
MARKMRRIVRFFMRRDALEREMDRELRFHIERQAEENMTRGMSPEQALRAARMSVGGLEGVKEECRDARLGRPIEATLQDVRYGARVLRKNPGFALAAILTLALGIGANTAIFSVVYGILLRPLPYRNGAELVVLHQQAPKTGLLDVPFSAHEIFDYRDGNHTLAGVVEHHTMSFLLLSKNSAERVNAAVVSPNFFDTLGVKPLMGRTFVASDDNPGADAVLVLSYKYWQTRHGGDPNIVGKVFRMNNRPHTVIGILPPIPQYPGESDVYMPTSACPFRSSKRFIENRQARMMTAFGRLKPGVPLETAQADLSRIAARLQASYPDVYPKQSGYSLQAAPLETDLTKRARRTFLVLLGAAGFVLLIACANVANLLLARLLKLERELAVRTALGASKLRLTRQLLTESVLLSTLGGALGVLAAPLALALLVKFAERFTTRAAEVKIDAPVLLFALIVSLLTGVFFGLAPALSSIGQTNDALRQGVGRATASPARQRLRAALVIAQVAVSFLLLIGAGLMMRSFWTLERVNPGFDPGRLLSMRITWSFSRYSTGDLARALAHNILRRLNALGGIESAVLTTDLPFDVDAVTSGPGSVDFELEGRPASKGELAPQVDPISITPDYFSTVRQRIVAGRSFTDHDDNKANPVAVVNQTMARHRWPNEDPVGKRISFDQGHTWTKIVGVVSDAKEYGLARSTGDEVYLPNDQAGFGDRLILRTTLDPLVVAPAVRAALHDVDQELAIDRVSSLERLREDSVGSERVTMMLLAVFAGLAVFISASGIAAVMALAVSQRTRELGIRMALGATRRSVLRAVVQRGFSLAVLGIALGVAAAIASSRLLAALLYATSPTDMLTFAGVSLLFVLVAVVACAIPARQVTAIDPVIALRQE